MRRRTRIRLVLVIVTMVAVIGTFFWMLSPRFTPMAGSENGGPIAPRDTSVSAEPDTFSSIPAQPEQPLPLDTASTMFPGTPEPAPGATPGGIGSDPFTFESAPVPGTPFTPEELDTLRLVIPVAGVTPDQLIDTYSDARSEGRVHNAIDIIAPRGTPVVATADGRIIKLFTSEAGGITLYQLSADGRRVYYYAHLDSYATGIAEGKPVQQGEVIGYVGDTGNATPGNHHLHFSIWIVDQPSRYWEGLTINPYPLLRRSGGAGTGK